MKKIKSIGYLRAMLFLIISVVAISCDEEDVKTAVASIEVSTTNLNVHESVEFTFTGVADQVSVFTGDAEHNYDKLAEYNTGFVVNKGKFTYSYKQPGTYKVVFIASCYGSQVKNLNSDTCSVILTVTDDNVSIEKISCPQVLYDEVFASPLNDEWFMKLPQKVLYNNREVAIASSQRLKIVLGSDSSKVKINGTSYIETSKYELKDPININVVSNSGTSKDYSLYMLYYPEFSNFEIAGIKGTIVRNEFAYDDLKLKFTIPQSLDISNIAPVFTTTLSSNKVQINELDQVSGVSIVDFSQPVSYTITSEVEGKPNLKTVSNFQIVINRE